MVTDELSRLLTEIRHRHWTLYRWGRDELMACVCRHYGYVDAVVLYGPDRAIGYRAIDTNGMHPLQPEIVVYEYAATPVYVLRALLGLPSPDNDVAWGYYTEIRGRTYLPKNLPKPEVIRPLAWTA